MGRVIAAYGGGFKPPTKGHFEIVKKALDDYPEIDEFIIYVGAKEREGMDQEESTLVWDIYHNYLANKVKIEPVKQPIGDILRLAKNNPQDTIYFVIGYREGRDDDLIDVAARTGNLKDKYPNIEVKVIPTYDPNISGTNARKALTISPEKFSQYLPAALTTNEKMEVYNILKPAEKLNEDIPSEVINSFNIQDTLVTDVWENNKLKPEIREKLLTIAQDFFDSLELPEGTVLKDIKLTGSLANYNWSKFSDVDLHLVLDYSQIADNEEFARDYFLAKKSIWNQTHDIDMFGYPVEVYVEDENDDHTASGLYSILNDKWINEPVLNKIVIDKEDIKSKAEGYLTQLPQIEALFNNGEYQKVIDSVDSIKEKLRNMRSSGLLKGGEYSVENLAFKVLRRTDFVEQLNNLKTKSYDSMMSVNENLNENATYSNNIDYKKQIKDLTKHMVSKGMNIKPLPKVRFIHNDQENAQDFLGKTAYYDPNNQTITLYTEGRHPKDIVRSFAHEMIHHIQFLEDRLDGVNTTNTMEDDNLNNIEREAYTDGNMTFRNWTDTINEAIIDDKIKCDECGWDWEIKDGGNDLFICHECGHDNEPVSEGGSLIPIKIKKSKPDPFGLNAYARELAIGLEEVINDELLMKDIELDHPITESTDYKIFSDMDGVLTDFDESFKKYSKGIAPRDYEKKFGKEKFWELIDGTGKVGFWVGMPWMGDGKQYWDYIKNYDTELLSSPSRSSTSRLGKRLWVKNNMPGIKLTLAQASHKQNYAAPNHILIDDRKSNIDQWISQGGIGILHTSASDTISQLKKLGL
mgnify:FL=1|tara:strand:- start:5641 stop:8055 length:2415 start_codon:yes stop_codon:yes gene_type:complete